MADIDKLNIDSIIQRLLEGEGRGRHGAGGPGVGGGRTGARQPARAAAPRWCLSLRRGGCTASCRPGGVGGGGAKWRGPRRFVLPGLAAAPAAPASPSALVFPSCSCPRIPSALPAQCRDQPALALLHPCSSKEMLNLLLFTQESVF